MEEKIQSLISKLTMELLQTKPMDPIPRIYTILHQITEERLQEEKRKAQAERGDPISEEQWLEYKVLAER